MLEALLQKPAAITPQEERTANPAAIPAAGIVIGTCESIGQDGAPLVTYPGGPPAPVPAASLVPFTAADAKRAIALSFPAGPHGTPLVLGFLWHPDHSTMPAESTGDPIEVIADGKALHIEAQESITLRCGKASMTLTADGQILMRGAYISSHSTGMQRIKGASVKLN